MQYAADQERFDHEGTYRLWEDMVLAYLRRASESGRPDPVAGTDQTFGPAPQS